MSHSHYSRKSSGLSMGDLNTSKKQSLRLAHLLGEIAVETGDNKYASMSGRVKYCATFWQGYYCPVCGKYHHMHTTGCKHRLCPICAVRGARVVAVQAMEALELMTRDDPSVSCSLLTLTQRNVPGVELSRTIDTQLEAWQRLRHKRLFGRTVLGWARTIEIVPALEGEEYHPHIHAIIVHRNLGALSEGAWWAHAWREAMGLDYFPVVDIRPIKDTQGAVYEVSKYVSKLSRVYDGSPREKVHVRVIGDAMYNRQLRTYGGAWLKARRDLNMMRVEQMDDDAISEYGLMADDKCETCKTEMTAVCLSWAGLSYMIDHHTPLQGLGVVDL